MNASSGYMKLTKIRTLLTGAGIVAALVVGGAANAAAVKLAAYNANPGLSTVSGISSGGYMAVQMHVAYSASFVTGAAIFAGGQFYCTKGSVSTAQAACMAGPPPAASEAINTTTSYASSGFIDPISNLQASKVYLYSGTGDTTVKQSVMNGLKAYYANYIPAGNIIYSNATAAAHAWISPYGPTAACGTAGDPYINKPCSGADQDPEQTFLTQMYGTLAAKNTGTLGGSFIEFDQTEFVDGGAASAHSMANSGWMYVPANCAAKKSCKVHIAYHGCQQYYNKIGDKFVKKSGLNEWADTNNIIVVYPQTVTMSGNPNGCWDWWAYDDANFAKKSGRQMLMSKRILDRIVSGYVSNSANAAPTALTVGTVTYNSVALSWTASAGATGYNVYRSGTSGGARTKSNTALITGTTHTAAGLSDNNVFYFSAKAVDSGALETLDSNIVTASTLTAPLGAVAGPTLTAGTATSTSVPLTWGAVSGATGYNIYLGTSTTGTRTKSNASPVTGTSYAVDGLTANTAYVFWGKSLDSSSLEGTESAAVSKTTLTPPFCKLWTASNYAHVQAARATTNASSHAVAVGSGADMGLYNTYTTNTLKEAPSGYYTISSDCASVIAIPTGLTIGAITNTSVALSWTAVSGASGYNAYQATTAIGAVTRANGATLITGTTYTVAGLQSNQLYYFQVAAQDASGSESQLSDQKSATTTTTAVAAPTALTVGAVGSSSVALSWTASAGATGYNIYSSDITGGVLTKANGGTVTGVSYTVGQLAASTQYFFKVKAYNGTSQESAASNEVNATTSAPAAITAPTALTVAAGATDTSVPVTFTASTSSDLLGSNMYYATVSGGPYTLHNTTPTSLTSYTFTGLNSSTTYYFVARAVNLSNQESADSTQASGATLSAKPAQPTSVAVADGTTDTSVPLSWTASTGPSLSGYNVYTASQTGGAYTKANATLLGTGTTYTVTKLQPDTSYFFIVRAQNASSVESVNSNEVASKTHAATYCKIWTASNYAHATASPKRAYTITPCAIGYACAIGSGTSLGLNSLGVYSTLKEKPKGYFAVGTTCP